MVALTSSLAEFIADLSLDRVPDAIRHEARRFIIDTFGCVVAGARSELGPIIQSAARLFGEGNEASVAGEGKRFTSLAASYGNGRLANCLDMDETYPGGAIPGCHFGASIFGEALAFCEQNALTTRELLLAVVCGYEVAGRISDIGNQTKIEAGRVTGLPEVWGYALAPTVGAAAATAKLLGQNAASMEQTFGMAASNAATPNTPIWSRQIALPNTNCFDAGWAAVAGGFAARSVEHGSTSISSIFDGNPNIFTMVGARHVDPDGIVGELGARWALTNTIYKPWPSCRAHHYSLDALRKLIATHRLKYDEIDEITVGVNASKLSRRHLNPEPPTFVAREFSFPHSIAMLLLDVPPGAEWGSERWTSDPTARRLRSKVKFINYPRAATSPEYFVRGQFRQMPCSVEVRVRDNTFRSEVDFAWGDPWSDETRFSDGDIVSKFRTVTCLPTETADEVIETIMVSDLGADLSPLFRAMDVSSSSPNAELRNRSGARKTSM
ncbi:MmgE/PrpD family protein [Bradyrhizobium sp. 25ACV]